MYRAAMRKTIQGMVRTNAHNEATICKKIQSRRASQNRTFMDTAPSSNENKMSDGHRERAALAVKRF